MKNTFLAAVVLLCMAAQAQTYTTFKVGGYSTFVTGINDAGEVVGYVNAPQYESGPLGPHGFWRTPKAKNHYLDRQLSPLEGGHFSLVSGINSSGELVGGIESAPARAFYMIPPATKPTSFLPNSNYPGNRCGFCVVGMAVNDAGWITGVEGNAGNWGEDSACFIETPQHTLFDGDIPIGWNGSCSSINNLNQVVGVMQPNANGAYEAFMYDANANTSTVLSVPGAISTSPAAINDSSEVVGQWYDANNVGHGFSWTAAAGFTSFDAPNSTMTAMHGINAAGTIVGYFTNAQAEYQSFTLANGTFTTIAVPGAAGTIASAINSSGVVVGTWITKTGQSRAFLYTPAK